jgi:hypothetical protein
MVVTKFRESRHIVTTFYFQGIRVDYTELNEEQRRQLIDAQQLFDAWWPAYRDLETGPKLYWNTSKGRRYLYEQRQGARRSLGPESSALRKLKDENDARLKSLRSRVRSLTARLEEMAPVNRAFGIARLPEIAAKIIRELDKKGLLGQHIRIAGTNALYAYEMAAGVFIGGRFTTTGDADLIWDVSQSLLLSATSVVRRDGLMSVLRRVDRSFRADYGLVCTNDRGYIVDLIVPDNNAIPIMRPEGDLEAQPIGGIEALLSGPAFEQVVVGGDGKPVRMVVPDPRAFALHKLWVSKRADRNPVKAVKDIAHARIVGDLAQTHLRRPLTANEVPWLPAHVRKLASELKKTISAEKESASNNKETLTPRGRSRKKDPR